MLPLLVLVLSIHRTWEDNWGAAIFCLFYHIFKAFETCRKTKEVVATSPAPGFVVSNKDTRYVRIAEAVQVHRCSMVYGYL